MELDIKYHAAENLFRSFWINLLETELTSKKSDSHQVIEIDNDQILYFDDFDIEIELLPNTKNKSMKLRLGDSVYNNLKEKYLIVNDIETISPDDEFPFITETTFTIRDLKKGTRFFSIVKKYRGI